MIYRECGQYLAGGDCACLGRGARCPLQASLADFRSRLRGCLRIPVDSASEQNRFCWLVGLRQLTEPEAGELLGETLGGMSVLGESLAGLSSLGGWISCCGIASSPDCPQISLQAHVAASV